jgi:hypothetical protein
VFGLVSCRLRTSLALCRRGNWPLPACFLYIVLLKHCHRNREHCVSICTIRMDGEGLSLACASASIVLTGASHRTRHPLGAGCVRAHLMTRMCLEYRTACVQVIVAGASHRARHPLGAGCARAPIAHVPHMHIALAYQPSHYMLAHISHTSHQLCGALSVMRVPHAVI